MYIVKYKISFEEMENFNPNIPLPVSIRVCLNKNGFKFEDDDKLSSANNENPTAIGRLERFIDPISCNICFRQTI